MERRSIWEKDNLRIVVVQNWGDSRWVGVRGAAQALTKSNIDLDNFHCSSPTDHFLVFHIVPAHHVNIVNIINCHCSGLPHPPCQVRPSSWCRRYQACFPALGCSRCLRWMVTWLIVDIIVCFLYSWRWWWCSSRADSGDVFEDGGDILEDGGDVLENVGDAAEGGGDVVEDGCDDVEDLLLLATSRLMRGLTGPWGGHARLAKLPSPLKPMPWSKLQKSKYWQNAHKN